MDKTIFFLKEVYDKDMVPKDDVLFQLSLNHGLFGTIKGYDEGTFGSNGNGMIFEYKNQPGIALKSSTVEHIVEYYNGIMVTTRNSVYVFRKTVL